MIAQVWRLDFYAGINNERKTIIETCCVCFPRHFSLVLYRTLFLSLMVFSGSNVSAAGGYEAIGHLTYTQFDSVGNAAGKLVMMFDVKVVGEEWHIRTEPVIEGKGVAFYEASYNTNDYVFRIKGLNQAYKSSESPFQSLRSDLIKSKRDDVFFTNLSRPMMPTTHSKSKNASNMAIALTFKGRYPPVDSSYIAPVWFAFTPPVGQKEGINKMLLQIWDDGNPAKNRFWQASWNQFETYPHLVSSAAYVWVGKEMLPNGSMININNSGVSKPEEMAVSYDVKSTTNFNGLVLPVNFKLTRFTPQRAPNRDQRLSSTIEAWVVQFNLVGPAESMVVKIPGKTFVTDYRLSGSELKGENLGYFLDSNIPPTVESLMQSSLYKHMVTEVKKSDQVPSTRWVFLGLLIGSSLVLIVFLACFVGTKHNKITR